MSYYGAAVGSCLAWTNLYLVLHILNGHVSREFTNRLVTVVHGAVISGVSAAAAISEGLCLAECAQSSSPLHNTIIIVSLGYFVFDFLWCLYTKSEESCVMLAHHVITIIAFLYVLRQGMYGCETVALLAISELTNPLLQLRWFLKYYGKHRGIVAILVDWTFALAFWFLRLVLGTILFANFVQNPQADVLAKATFTAFFAVSAIFSIQIAQYIAHQCKKSCMGLKGEHK